MNMTSLARPLSSSTVFFTFLLLCGGCFSIPTPANRTTPWQPPEELQKPDDTWTATRQQAVNFSKPLTLSELVAIALENNPATFKTWNEAKAAVAQVKEARGYFMPTISAVAGATRQKTSADPDTFNQDYWKYNPGFQMNYLVFNFGGGRQAAVDAALQTVCAANFLFNRSIQDVLLDVETSYYLYISAQANVEAAEINKKDALSVWEAAKNRAKAGVGTELEVLQAKAEFDQSQYALANAQGLFRAAQGHLAQSLGLPADTPVQAAQPVTAVPEILPIQDMKQLIDAALWRRPDIGALRASVAAKEALVKVAGSSLWPSLYLNGNLNREFYDTVSGKEMQDHDWTMSAGALLEWKLFDGMQTLNAKSAARAQMEALKAQLVQTELAASAEVWTRYHAYDTALQKYAFSVSYLESASAAYDMALNSYKAGVKSILDVLSAENVLAQARSQQIASRLEAFTALIRLAYATGVLEQGDISHLQHRVINSSRKEPHP